MEKLNIKFVSQNASDVYKDGELLKYQTIGSSGFDLKAVSILDPKTKENRVFGKDLDVYVLEPMKRICVQIGFAIGGVPENYEVQVRPRSGLAFRNGITIVNTPGTIDSDYRGEIGALLCNLSDENFEIRRGDRIAQMIVCPIVKCEINVVDEIEKTSRGEGHFGSTGTKD